MANTLPTVIPLWHQVFVSYKRDHTISDEWIHLFFKSLWINEWTDFIWGIFLFFGKFILGCGGNLGKYSIILGNHSYLFLGYNVVPGIKPGFLAICKANNLTSMLWSFLLNTNPNSIQLAFSYLYLYFIIPSWLFLTLYIINFFCHTPNTLLPEYNELYIMD